MPRMSKLHTRSVFGNIGLGPAPGSEPDAIVTLDDPIEVFDDTWTEAARPVTEF